ncbi:hypothetical protein [uncultured Tateyamaria sp.]|uniref:hypothetical protein n=1 Tax=uncultured Tateyamaria sp. TaxID=455651 RepID=UPI00262CB9A0|nr:hypothetical protein [uncultured Tateyamaria sp.]
MSIFNFDRDLQYVSVANDRAILPAEHPVGVPRASTNGAVYEVFGSISRSDPSNFSMAAGRRLAGLFILPPDPFTRAVYRLKGFAVNDGGPGYANELVVGVGPSAPSGDDPILNMVPVHAAQNSVRFDETIALDNFGTIGVNDYSDRPVFFGVAFTNLSGNVTPQVNWLFSLSVQRLAVKNPPYESALR